MDVPHKGLPQMWAFFRSAEQNVAESAWLKIYQRELLKLLARSWKSLITFWTRSSKHRRAFQKIIKRILKSNRTPHPRDAAALGFSVGQQSSGWILDLLQRVNFFQTDPHVWWVVVVAPPRSLGYITERHSLSLQLLLTANKELTPDIVLYV